MFFEFFEILLEEEEELSGAALELGLLKEIVDFLKKASLSCIWRGVGLILGAWRRRRRRSCLELLWS